MAFLRFSRDKRGYEHTYLVQPTGRRGKSPPRVLYWFRTPPNIRVGREPFDENVRRALEAQHRDVAFNWPRLLATPIPPPDTERWRERRRAERAARRPVETEVDAAAGVADPGDGASLELSANGAERGTPESPEHIAEADGEQAEGDGALIVQSSGPSPAATSGEPRRRRRRRRRRGRGPGGQEVAAGSSTEPSTSSVDPGLARDGE